MPKRQRPYLVRFEARVAYRTWWFHQVVWATDSDEAMALGETWYPNPDEERDFGANTYLVRPVEVLGEWNPEFALEILTVTGQRGPRFTQRKDAAQVDRMIKRKYPWY